MMTSQILKSLSLTKTQKPRYLKNETFFLQYEKNQELHIKGYFIAKNGFVAEVTPISGYYRSLQEKIRTN